MKRNVILDIPISAGTLKFEEPCTYCGEEATNPDHYFNHKITYKLKKWGVGRKTGNTQIFDVVKDGVAQTRDVIIQIPYCDKHAQGIKAFKVIKIVSTILFLIGSMFAAYFYWLSADDEEAILNLIVVGGILFGGFAIGYSFGALINVLITQVKPEYRDFPTFNPGHWGVAFEGIQYDYGHSGIGPITYYIRVGFLDWKSARRNLIKNSGTRIKKGEDLVWDSKE